MMALAALILLPQGVWADSVIFSMTSVTGVSGTEGTDYNVAGNVISVIHGKTLDLTATYTGGSAKVKNGHGTKDNLTINTSSGVINIANSGNSYLYITLSSTTIQEGDIIALSGYKDADNSSFYISASTSKGSVSHSFSSSYAVPEGSGLIGKASVYFWNNKGATISSITITRPQPAAPVFSPASGESVAQGSKVTVTSQYATTIQYKWTASDATPADGWTDYTDGALVPEEAAGTPYLHVQCTRDGVDGVTTGYAQYTITGADTDAPELVSTTPADAATDIAIAGNIVLTFNENVACTTNATLTPEGGEAIELTPTVSGTTVTYSYSALAYQKAHTFSLAASSVTDVSGNPYASAISFSFTTAQEVCADPVITNVAGRCFYITCATDGATIYYTVDDDDPVSSAEKKEFTLTGDNMMTIATAGTHTIYTYAEKAGAVTSAVVNKSITIPGAATTTGSLLMTLSPEVIASDDTQYDSNTFTKGGYTLSNTNNLSNTDIMPNYHPMFKASAGTLTVTAPADVTIESIKVYVVRNGNKSYGTISNAEGSYTRTPSDVNRIIPRYTYFEDGTPAVSEYSFAKETPDNECAFKIDGQCRLYVEVYGTTTALTETINRAKELTTYVPTYNLDFSTVASDVKAYIATGATAAEVTMQNVNIVPAGTPVLLKATTLDTDIAVPVTTSTSDVSANKLKCGDGKTSIGGEGKYDYVLSNGKFYHASAGVLAVGKCYLHLDAAPAEANFLTLNFDENTTSLREKVIVNSEKFATAQYYDLQGRRVVQPTKGLYIVNGRKVVIK